MRRLRPCAAVLGGTALAKERSCSARLFQTKVRWAHGGSGAWPCSPNPPRHARNPHSTTYIGPTWAKRHRAGPRPPSCHTGTAFPESSRFRGANNISRRPFVRSMMRCVLLAVVATASALKANSWQARVDKALLSVDLGVRPRLRLLSRAAKDPKLQEDVKSAVEAIREKGFGKGQCVHANGLICIIPCIHCMHALNVHACACACAVRLCVCRVPCACAVRT
jgi:hypothetical protein